MNKRRSQMSYLLALCLFCLCMRTSPQTLAQLTEAVEESKATTPNELLPHCRTLEFIYAARLGAIQTELNQPEDEQEARRIAGEFTNENGSALTTAELEEQRRPLTHRALIEAQEATYVDAPPPRSLAEQRAWVTHLGGQVLSLHTHIINIQSKNPRLAADLKIKYEELCVEFRKQAKELAIWESHRRGSRA